MKTLWTCFHIYLHSYHHHHHPVFSSTGWAQHSYWRSSVRQARPGCPHSPFLGTTVGGRVPLTVVRKDTKLLHPLHCHPRGVLTLPKSDVLIKHKVSKICLYATWSYQPSCMNMALLKISYIWNHLKKKFPVTEVILQYFISNIKKKFFLVKWPPQSPMIFLKRVSF